MLEPLPETSTPLELVTQLRTQVAPRVGAGNWNAVRELLAGNGDTLQLSGELTALYGEALLRTGRSQAAREWLSQALLHLEARGERVALRRVMNLLGVALFELGMLEAAASTLEQVAEVAWSNGDDLLL